MCEPEDESRWLRRVQCSGCGREVDEAEAQAVRWGYWSDDRPDLYPYCPECAVRELSRSSS